MYVLREYRDDLYGVFKGRSFSCPAAWFYNPITHRNGGIRVNFDRAGVAVVRTHEQAQRVAKAFTYRRTYV